MRLLVTASSTIQLQYYPERPPPYAILSHRWRDDEVTLQDINRPDVSSMKGYDKLVKACKLAGSLGFKYLWMDTCCIDKSSSAELTEAINSMYRWYKEAGLCLAYLDDVEAGYSISSSTWFTRGWTLQELLAPTEVLFLIQDWSLYGTKTSEAAEIEDRTGIQQSVLLTGSMEGIPIARKMFWAASRETTRVEDEAYSLLGIFGVTLPAIYGESRNAFIRLQEEIMRNSTDQSIYAWGMRRSIEDYEAREQHDLDQDIGLLATSPMDFEDSGDIELLSFPEFEKQLGVSGMEVETEVTNLGTRVKLPRQRLDVHQGKEFHLAYLACQDGSGNSLMAIELQRLSSVRFARVSIYNSPYLYHVPYHATKRAEITSDPIYVTREPRKPWEGSSVLAVIRIQMCADIAARHGLWLTGCGELNEFNDWTEVKPTDSLPSYVSATEPGVGTCLLFHHKTEKWGTIVCLIIEPSRHNRADKNFFSVRITSFGRPDDKIPFSNDNSEESVRELLRLWKESGTFDAPVSPFASIELQEKARMSLVIICDSEVAWDNLDGENPCEYTLWAQTPESASNVVGSCSKHENSSEYENSPLALPDKHVNAEKVDEEGPIDQSRSEAQHVNAEQVDEEGPDSQSRSKSRTMIRRIISCGCRM